MPSRSRTRVYVVTGASSGIGAAVAQRLSTHGHRLVLAARNEQALQEVAGRCQRNGSTTITLRTDVTVENDCRRLVDRTLEAFGRIDVLVNGAGASVPAEFDRITDWSIFERVWRVNCFGTINCTRFAWPYLKGNAGKRGGQVVGIGELAGRRGMPGGVADCASRFAQAGFLEALRIEAAEHDVTVTVVYPHVATSAMRQSGPNGAGRLARAAAPDAAGAVALEQCARRIVSAIESRRHELVISATGPLGRRIRLMANHWVDRLVRRRQRKEEPND